MTFKKVEKNCYVTEVIDKYKNVEEFKNDLRKVYEQVINEFKDKFGDEIDLFEFMDDRKSEIKKSKYFYQNVLKLKNFCELEFGKLRKLILVLKK